MENIYLQLLFPLNKGAQQHTSNRKNCFTYKSLVSSKICSHGKDSYYFLNYTPGITSNHLCLFPPNTPVGGFC